MGLLVVKHRLYDANCRIVRMTWAALLVAVFFGHAFMADAQSPTNSPEALREQYASLQANLVRNQFQRPVFLDSTDQSGVIKGNIYAVVNTPFEKSGAALSAANNWCEILFLHLNTQYCRVAATGKETSLDVRVGKKYDRPLGDAYRLAFDFRLVAKTNNYLLVNLAADKGPLNTRDYRIVLEAIPLQGKTFLHLSYSYGYGLMGKMAAQTYFNTVARQKVGFTVTGKQGDDSPRYVTGMRAAVERNTMRYYLAMEAFLTASSGAPQERLDKSLRAWFAATERYPRQLHEIGLQEYLDTKRSQYKRQQTDAIE